MNGEEQTAADVGLAMRPRRLVSTWLLALAWILTLVALGLHARLIGKFWETVSNKHVINDPADLLIVVGSPLAALLAIACPGVTWLTRKASTLRLTLVWILLALVSIVGWPMACAISAVATYHGPFVIP